MLDKYMYSLRVGLLFRPPGYPNQSQLPNIARNINPLQSKRFSLNPNSNVNPNQTVNLNENQNLNTQHHNILDSLNFDVRNKTQEIIQNILDSSNTKTENIANSLKKISTNIYATGNMDCNTFP